MPARWWVTRHSWPAGRPGQAAPGAPRRCRSLTRTGLRPPARWRVAPRPWPGSRPGQARLARGHGRGFCSRGCPWGGGPGGATGGQPDDLRERWAGMLRALAERDGAIPGLLRGAAARLLLDDGRLAAEEVARLMGLALSPGTGPLEAAGWVEGFLAGGGMLLVHDERLLGLVDGWLAGVPGRRSRTYCRCCGGRSRSSSPACGGRSASWCGAVRPRPAGAGTPPRKRACPASAPASTSPAREPRCVRSGCCSAPPRPAT